MKDVFDLRGRTALVTGACGGIGAATARALGAHEVAGVVVMLVGAAGAFITGQNLVVDGGTTISDGS